MRSALARLPRTVLLLRNFRFIRRSVPLTNNRLITNAIFPRDVLVNGKGSSLFTVRRIYGGVHALWVGEIQARVRAHTRYFSSITCVFNSLLKHVPSALNVRVRRDILLRRRQGAQYRHPRQVGTLFLRYRLRQVNHVTHRLRLLRFRPRIHLVRPNYFRLLPSGQRLGQVKIDPYRYSAPRAVLAWGARRFVCRLD